MPKIKASFVSIVWLLALIGLKTPHLFPTLAAVALHEAGHIFFANVLKIKIKCVHLSLLGARLEVGGEISYARELLLALGGPLLGLLGFAGTFLPAQKCESPQLLYFSIISLVLALFNLLPLESLDGGRILKCLLCLCFKLEIAAKIMSVLSFLTIFVLWLFSVYVMLKISTGLTTFVFCSFFFAKCFIFNKKNGDLERF